MTARDELIEHGTYAGYHQERKLDLPTCDDCRRARNAYMVEYRKRRADYVERAKRQRTAREKAQRRLARLHHAEFQALLTEELASSPPHTGPRGERS